jgi:hypothetical protein
MTKRSAPVAWRASCAGLSILLVGLGCHRSGPAAAPVAVPRLPAGQLMAQPPVLAQPGRTEVDAGLPEPRVTLITGDHDMDVKQALEYISRRGGYGLALSPNLKTRVRLNLVDVPVSEALQAVLAQANLTLAGSNGGVTVAWNPSIVFFQLPINVDSVSVVVMMKRFGVSRELAEVIIKSRNP